MNADTLTELYRWAGFTNRKAAIYLLATACDGRLLETAVRTTEHGEPYVDPARVQPQGWESGSEQRILALAYSLLAGEPVDLSWAVGNHDSTNALAIAIATGAHLAD